MAPRQRPVLAGVGFDLGAIHADLADLEHAYFARQYQHLHKQLFQLRAKATSECGQRIVIRVRVGGNVAKCDRVIRCAFNLAARRYARCIAIDQ
jgi:hypothetical protein